MALKETAAAKKRSLVVILSAIVALIIVIVFAVFIGIMRTSFVNTSDRLYVNQLQNFSDDIERQVADFLQTEVRNAQVLAKHPTIINAAQTGEFEKARPFLRAFYYEKGIYEQVFISTMEKNSRITASGDGKADGVRWGEIPVYVKNVEMAMQGKTYTSNPGKSPVTGLVVILVTVPIMAGNTPIGIIGLPVDIGTYSEKIVKKIKIGKTGYPFITTIDGMTFAHPDKENIFKLNIKDYEWGRQMLADKEGTIVRYEWKGKDKVLTFARNTEFRFIVGATLYSDDYMDEITTLDLILFPLALILLGGSSIGIYIFMKRRLGLLQQCETVMNSLASGDLTKRYDGSISNDEIGSITTALNNTADQFEKLISEIVLSVQNLAQAVDQISSGNQNLSQRTSEQASSLEEIASTIEEATAAIRQNADNSGEANKLAEVTTKMAEEGNRVVIGAVASINEMNKSSKKIEEIISLINEISFQTNLLALNAAVEAARAGEQGRGFAVVAGEVRNLAQRSANAAKEIGGLIKDSIEKINVGTNLANQSGDALREIVASMKNVARLISEIAAASYEQKQGIDQINTAVSEMDTMTQQNAALVEETASASEEMAGQAKEMQAMVERFKISEMKLDSTYAVKHKEMHLKAAETAVKAKAAAKNEATKNERRKSQEEKKATGAGRSVSETLKEEGFEEF